MNTTSNETTGRGNARSVCLDHPERSANRVCSVCGKYFCEDCVDERYYPQFAHICNYCSGKKPQQELARAPEAAIQEEGTEEQRWLAREATPRWRKPSVEWFVFSVCLFLIGARVWYWQAGSEPALRLASEAPSDVAMYCLGKLDQMEYGGLPVTYEMAVAACPPPLSVVEEADFLRVTAPDESTYGFSLIDIEHNPTTLIIEP